MTPVRGALFVLVCASQVFAASPAAATGSKNQASGESSSTGPAGEPKEEKPRTGLWGPRFAGRPWELQIALDYSRSIADVYGLEVDPYRLGLGLSAGYFWPGGFGLSLNGNFYTGSTISQIYDPPLTQATVDLNAKTQLFDFGLAASYDQPLGPILLRYSLGVSFGFMNWDFGPLPYTSIAGYSVPTGSAFVLSLDPGLAAIWPIGSFFAIARVHSRVSFSAELPNALGGTLGMGVRF